MTYGAELEKLADEYEAQVKERTTNDFDTFIADYLIPHMKLRARWGSDSFECNVPTHVIDRHEFCELAGKWANGHGIDLRLYGPEKGQTTDRLVFVWRAIF